MDLLAAVPSVVFGLVGLPGPEADAADAGSRRSAGGATASRCCSSVFGKGSSGTSLLTAGIVLAIMITPIITSITREVFITVPRNDKEGRAGPRRHPLGDDHRRRAAPLERRPDRRRDARPRAGRWARRSP